MNNLQEKLLSVVIPAYNEQDMISTTFHTVKTILDNENIPFELLFIDASQSFPKSIPR